ncbi:hypothetical protein WDU99_06650 [Microbacterium sp. Mu-80]|uniref:Cardiolipin synthase N-terminal domain-containing protein n=1 Tax=Microbacterium bandirmense TaxID=3122050 RepID=A0ABU8LBA9_9MICO
MSLWEYLGYLLWGVLIVSYLLVLLHVLTALFRSGLSGWMKAVWVLLLFVLPLVSVLIWLIMGGYDESDAARAQTGSGSSR